MKKKKKYLSLFVSVLVFVLGYIVIGASRGANNTQIAHAATIYKSPTCGCCGNYVTYLKRYGYDVEVVDIEDMDSVKREYNIPQDMESCHTTVTDEGYVVEGHIPVEAMNKLLEEKPVVNGIAMPGMPVGSPGMPGTKNGKFIIHQLDIEGTSEFMQL